MVATQQSTLERFRRVARNHGLSDVSERLDASDEIELLRTYLNGKVYRNAENWMNPSWAVRSGGRPLASSSGDEPFENNQRRNWTTVGGVGSHHYAFCDSKGLLTVIPECGSIEFWLLAPTGMIFPSMAAEDGSKITLLSAEDQVYEWKMSLGPIEFSRLIYHATEEDNEAIYNEIQIRNLSLERAKLTFYAVVRPMSVKGVEPIDTAEYSKPKRTIYTNGLLALRTDREPKCVYMGTADSRSLASTIADPAPKFDTEFSSPNGLATVIARFDVVLRPAGVEHFFFVSPFGRFTKTDSPPLFSTNSQARDATVQTWFEFMDSTLSGEFPDRELGPMLTQSKAIAAMQIRTSLAQDETGITGLSWTERARLLSALCRHNCLALAEQVSLQTIADGRSDVLTNQSTVAPFLWSILQVFEYSRSTEYLQKIRPLINAVLPMMVKNAESYLTPTFDQSSQELATEVPEFGQGTAEATAVNADETSEVSPSASQKTFEPRLERLSGFVAAAWLAESLRSAAGAFANLGDVEHSKSIDDILAGYTDYVQACSRDLADRIAREGIKTCILEEDIIDAVALLGTVALLRTKAIDSRLLDYVIKEIDEKWLTIFRMVKLPSRLGEHSIHLTMLLAHYYVLNKNRSEASTMLRAVLKFLSGYHVLPDWVNPKTGGGSHGSGCSVVAAADLMLLLRDMIVCEEGEDLIILPGTPQEWYTSNNPLVLRNVPTTRGMIQIEMGASANQRQIELRSEFLPREIEAYLPTSRAVSMVKLYGGALVGRFASSVSPHVRAVPLSEDIVLAFHR